MATRLIHDRIPRSSAEAAVANLPQWMQKKIGDMKGASRRVQDAPQVLRALLDARDSDLPEAKALAERVLGNKELMAEFAKLLASHGIELPAAAPVAKEPSTASGNGLSAARNEVAGSAEEREQINRRIAKEEGLAEYDAASASRKAGTFDAKLKAASLAGAINPARVAMGLPDQVATADDLFALGREGK
ncbi:hypothetical protein AB3X96_18060 [Paraburkholderia sp. BR13439]|uniref:hypothetical protein n=1 Tax=Paraburkholderia sp. BR13439 TaxID=3236996 RepID=UPI0034CD05C4